MDKKKFAILVMRDEMDVVKEKLKKFDLVVVNEEEMNELYALTFGIWPTAETIKKFPLTAVLIVEGTEEQYEKYCNTPESDIGEYWVA